VVPELLHHHGDVVVIERHAAGGFDADASARS